MKLTDEKLVSKVRSGETSAYEGLFDKYQTAIYNFSYSIAGNAEDAKDVSQRAFLNV